jgi:hypothetical protein
MAAKAVSAGTDWSGRPVMERVAGKPDESGNETEI